MDFLLFSAAVGSTACFPKQTPLSLHSSKSMKVAFGLCMGMFSLSILEVLPSSWLVVLDHGPVESGVFHSGYLTVTGAYWILLWVLCVWTVLILPGMVGGRVHANSDKLRRSFHDTEKKGTGGFLPIACPWWILLLVQFVLLIWGILHNMIMMPLYRRLRRRYEDEPLLLVGTHKSPSNNHDRSSLRLLRTGTTLSSPLYMTGAAAGIIITCVILRTLASLIIYPHGEHYNILATLVSWLCAVGLLLSSILNGFGSVSLPHSCLAGYYLEPIQPTVIAQAESGLLSAKSALQQMVAERSNHSGHIVVAPSTNRRKQASRKCFAEYGNSEEGDQHKKGLQNDVEFLDMLVAELEADITEMKYAQFAAGEARTPMGKVKSIVGMLFSGVLLIRLFNSIASVIQMDDTTSTSSAVDPITTVLLWLNGHHYVSQQDYAVLSQGISLLLTVFLSFSQFRTFLRTAEAVYRRLLLLLRQCQCTHKRDVPLAVVDHGLQSETSQVYGPVLAALTGCYCLSCVVLTKMSLPLEYRAGFSAALGGMDYTIQSSMLNLVFSVSAAISVMVLGVLLGIQRQNSKRHSTLHTETLSCLDVLNAC